MNLEFYQLRRKELKLTYDDIANISGVGRRTIAGFFSGDPKYQNPSVTTLEAIKRALQLDDGTEAEKRAAEAVERVAMHTVVELKAEKERRGLTYDEIADRAGLPRSTVTNALLERVDSPRVDTLLAIGRAIYGDDGVPVVPAGEVLTEKQKRLLAAFDALIPPLQDYVIETTEKLVAQVGKSNASDKRA